VSDTVEDEKGKTWNLIESWSYFGLSGGSGKTTSVCPLCSAARKDINKKSRCVSINFDRETAKCSHCEELFMIKKGYSPQNNTQTARKKEVYVKPKDEIKSDIPEKMLSWLYDRGITKTVIERNKIGHSVQFFHKHKKRKPCISIPYLKDGEVVGVKYRVDKPKDWTAESGTEPVIYGHDDIKGDWLIWVEGEFDKLAVEVAGFENCVSVPNGAKSAGSLENLKDKLAGIKIHIIAVDNDKDGNHLKKDLIRRLNPAKCRTVKWTEGCKDANEVLVNFGKDAVKRCIEDNENVPIDGMIKPSALISKLKDLYYNDQEEGLSTGWGNLGKLYRVRTGQWTVITGIPNHCKSEFLDAMMVNMIVKHGWKFGIYSPENHPVEIHMRKILKKVTGKPYGKSFNGTMKWDEAESCSNNFDDFLTFVGDREDGHTVETILKATEDLVFSEGINGMIIDPWNAIEHSRTGNMSETEYVSKQLSRVSQLVRKYDIHLWIVAHPTKLQKKSNGTYDPPLPYDISGSANWNNKADNAITVHIPTGDDVQENEVKILVNKIKFRENGRPGETTLFFNQTSGRYSVTPI